MVSLSRNYLTTCVTESSEQRRHLCSHFMLPIVFVVQIIARVKTLQITNEQKLFLHLDLSWLTSRYAYKVRNQE